MQCHLRRTVQLQSYPPCPPVSSHLRPPSFSGSARQAAAAPSLCPFRQVVLLPSQLSSCFCESKRLQATRVLGADHKRRTSDLLHCAQDVRPDLARLPAYLSLPRHGALLGLEASLGRVAPSQSRRRQPHDPQPNLVVALAHRPARPRHPGAGKAATKGPQDIDPCVHGLRSREGTITMGQGTRTGAGKDRAHEGCRRPVLAAGDPRQQSQTRAR